MSDTVTSRKDEMSIIVGLLILAMIIWVIANSHFATYTTEVNEEPYYIVNDSTLLEDIIVAETVSELVQEVNDDY